MDNQAALERILAQLSELIDTLQNQQGPLNPEASSTDLNEQLDFLEKTVTAFSDIQVESFQAHHVDPDALIKESLKSPETPLRDKQFLQQAQESSLNIRALQIIFFKAEKEAKKRKRGKTNPTSKQMRERRKLFKTIGGDKNWIPL